MGGLSLFLTLSIVSCKKAEVKPSNRKTEVSEQNGNVENLKMMIFNTSDEYDQLINKSENEKRIELEKIRKQPFISRFEKQKNEKSLSNEINDEFLLSILNEDNIVQIGSFLYKLNILEEKVYVLSASKIDEYTDLVNENLKNKNVRKFSTQESVIELAESGALGEKGLICSEDGVGSRSQSVNQSNGTNNTSASSKLSHNKFGIYFTITLETWSNESLGSTFVYEFSSNTGERTYKVKCDSWGYAPSNYTSIYGTVYAKFNIASTSRNFSRYNVLVRTKLYQGSGTSKFISTSSWMQIRANL